MDHRLKDIFRVAAGKHLSAVDADSSRSHQHEIGGLVKVGFGEVLGKPRKTEVFVNNGLKVIHFSSSPTVQY